MKKYELEKVYDGYIIREKGKCVWVKSYTRYGYKFVLDHTYAQHFSKKTADKHLQELNQKGR